MIFSDYFFKGYLSSYRKKGNYNYTKASFGCYDENGVYYYFVNTIGVSNLQALAKSGILSQDITGLEDLKKIDEEENPILLYYEFKK